MKPFPGLRPMLILVLEHWVKRYYIMMVSQEPHPTAPSPHHRVDKVTAQQLIFVFWNYSGMGTIAFMCIGVNCHVYPLLVLKIYYFIGNSPEPVICTTYKLKILNNLVQAIQSVIVQHFVLMIPIIVYRKYHQNMFHYTKPLVLYKERTQGSNNNTRK